jgi:hypothetical protein
VVEVTSADVLPSAGELGSSSPGSTRMTAGPTLRLPVPRRLFQRVYRRRPTDLLRHKPSDLQSPPGVVSTTTTAAVFLFGVASKSCTQEGGRGLARRYTVTGRTAVQFGKDFTDVSEDLTYAKQTREVYLFTLKMEAVCSSKRQ